MSRPTFESLTKPDRVHKLDALWHEPLNTSFNNNDDNMELRSSYVNESAFEAYKQKQREMANYESPIKMRRKVNSVISNSDNEFVTPSTSSGSGDNRRPQSYIDMQAGANKVDDQLLMSFKSSTRDESLLNDFNNT